MAKDLIEGENQEGEEFATPGGNNETLDPSTLGETQTDPDPTDPPTDPKKKKKRSRNRNLDIAPLEGLNLDAATEKSIEDAKYAEQGVMGKAGSDGSMASAQVSAAIKKSKYEGELFPGQDIEVTQALEQGNARAIFNSIYKAGAGAVAELVATPGYLHEAVEDWQGTQDGFKSTYIVARDRMMENAQEFAPVHINHEAMGDWNVTNGEWWAKNVEQLGPTLAMMAVSFATDGLATPAILAGVARLGVAARYAKFAESLLQVGSKANIGGRAIISATSSRILEATMEGHQTQQAALAHYLKQGKSREEAVRLSSEDAKEAMTANMGLVLVDALQHALVFKGLSGDSFAKKGINYLGTMSANIATEMMEEGYQFIVSEKAVGQHDFFTGGGKKKSVSHLMGEQGFQDAIEGGAFGGGIFQGGGDLISKGTDAAYWIKSKEHREYVRLVNAKKAAQKKAQENIKAQYDALLNNDGTKGEILDDKMFTDTISEAFVNGTEGHLLDSLEKNLRRSDAELASLGTKTILGKEVSPREFLQDRKEVIESMIAKKKELTDHYGTGKEDSRFVQNLYNDHVNAIFNQNKIKNSKKRQGELQAEQDKLTGGLGTGAKKAMAAIDMVTGIQHEVDAYTEMIKEAKADPRFKNEDGSINKAAAERLNEIENITLPQLLDKLKAAKEARTELRKGIDEKDTGFVRNYKPGELAKVAGDIASFEAFDKFYQAKIKVKSDPKYRKQQEDAMAFDMFKSMDTIEDVIESRRGFMTKSKSVDQLMRDRIAEIEDKKAPKKTKDEALANSKKVAEEIKAKQKAAQAQQAATKAAKAKPASPGSAAPTSASPQGKNNNPPGTTGNSPGNSPGNSTVNTGGSNQGSQGTSDSSTTNKKTPEVNPVHERQKAILDLLSNHKKQEISTHGLAKQTGDSRFLIEAAVKYLEQTGKVTTRLTKTRMIVTLVPAKSAAKSTTKDASEYLTFTVADIPANATANSKARIMHSIAIRDMYINDLKANTNSAENARLQLRVDRELEYLKELVEWNSLPLSTRIKDTEINISESKYRIETLKEEDRVAYNKKQLPKYQEELRELRAQDTTAPVAQSAPTQDTEAIVAKLNEERITAITQVQASEAIPSSATVIYDDPYYENSHNGIIIHAQTQEELIMKIVDHYNELILAAREDRAPVNKYGMSPYEEALASGMKTKHMEFAILYDLAERSMKPEFQPTELEAQVMEQFTTEIKTIIESKEAITRSEAATLKSEKQVDDTLGQDQFTKVTEREALAMGKKMNSILAEDSGEVPNDILGYDYGRSQTGNNLLAYLARAYDQFLDKLTLTLKRKDISDGLNENLPNKDILDFKKFNVGTKLTLVVKEDPDMPVYDPKSNTKEETTWGALGLTDKNSAEYEASVPIVAIDSNGNEVAYIHVEDWIKSENLTGNIKQDKARLKMIRKAIIAAGPAGIKTKITDRSNGFLFRVDKRVPVSQGIPTGKIVIQREDLRGATEAERAKVINTSMTSEKNGITYSMVEVNKGKLLAIPIVPNTLEDRAVQSILEALKIYMAADKDNELAVQAKKLGIDLTTFNGFKRYVQLFTNVVNVPDTAKLNEREGHTYTSNLERMAYGLHAEYRAISIEKYSDDDAGLVWATGRGSAGKRGNNKITNKTNPEKIATLYADLEAHLRQVYHNADTVHLTIKKPIPMASKNANGSISVVTHEGGYTSYIADNFNTDVMGQNIGTEEDPNYIYTIQAKLEFDTSFVGKPAEPKGTEEVKVKEDGKSTEEEVEDEVDLIDMEMEEFFVKNQSIITPYMDKSPLILIEGLKAIQQDDLVSTLAEKIARATFKQNGLGRLAEKAIYDEVLASVNARLEVYKRGLTSKKTLADPNRLAFIQATIKSHQAVVDNWGEVGKLTKEYLSGRSGLKVVTSNEEIEILEEESQSNKTSFADEASLMLSGKDTISSDLKIFFSYVPSVRRVTKNTFDADGNSVSEDIYVQNKNFIGEAKFESFDEVFNNLSAWLADGRPDYAEMIAILEEFKDRHPWVQGLIQELGAAPQQIRNEFVTAMTKHSVRMRFILHGDGNSGYTMRLMDDNYNSIVNHVTKSWVNNIKLTGLLNFDNGIETYNIDKVNEIIDEIDSLELNREATADDVKALLASVGITINDGIAQDIKDGTYNTGRQTVAFASQFSTGGIFKIIKQKLQIASDPDAAANIVDNNRLLNDPAFNRLASKEARNLSHKFSGSFRAGDKTIQGYTNNTFLSNRFWEIKNTNLIDALTGTAYASHASWIDVLGSTKSRDLFNMTYLSLAPLKQKNSKNLTEGNLSKKTKKEHEVTKLGAFFGRAREYMKVDYKAEDGSLHDRVMKLATYFYSTTSDKSKVMAIDAVSEMVSIDTDGNVSDETLELVVKSLVQSEVTRMKSHKHDEMNMKGYNDGKRMFLLFPELNNIKDLFDTETGELLDDVLDNPVTRKLIDNKIREYLQAEIDVKLQEWKKFGIGALTTSKNYADQDVSSYKFLDSGYVALAKKLVPKGATKDLTVAYAATDFVVNNMLAQHNFSAIFWGDPAIYYKKSEANKGLSIRDEGYNYEADARQTFSNIGKRLAAEVAPGYELAGSHDMPNYKVAMLTDRFVKSSILEYYKELGINDVSEYERMEGTDAQEFTTWQEHVTIMYRTGRLAKEDFDAAMSSKGVFSEDLLKKVMQPMKPVYAGNKIDASNNGMYSVDRRFYIKSSSFPLIPQLTKGLEIDKLRVAMEKGGIDRVAFGSGVKVGNVAEQLNIWKWENAKGEKIDNAAYKELSDAQQKEYSQSNEIGEIKFDDTNVVELPRKNFRIQQDIPYDPSKSEVTMGSQGSHLIWVNILDQVGDLNDQFVQAHKNLYAYHRNKLAKKMGFKKGTNQFDMGKLQELVIEEAQSRGYSLNDVLGLTLKQAGDRKVFEKAIWDAVSGKKMESLLMSIVDNKVRKMKFPGKSFVLGTAEGFEAIASAKPQILEGAAGQKEIERIQREANAIPGIKSLDERARELFSQDDNLNKDGYPIKSLEEIKKDLENGYDVDDMLRGDGWVEVMDGEFDSVLKESGKKLKKDIDGSQYFEHEGYMYSRETIDGDVMESKITVEEYAALLKEEAERNANNPDSNTVFQNNTGQSKDNYVASEKTIREIAARMSSRIGIPVKFVNDSSLDYKGKLDVANDGSMTAVVNLAHATLDTPIHEILGHPIIRAIKNKRFTLRKGSEVYYLDPKMNDYEIFTIEEFVGDYEIGVKLKDSKGNIIDAERQELSPVNKNPLYTSLLKELETGKGKEVFDRIKKDYDIKIPATTTSKKVREEIARGSISENPMDFVSPSVVDYKGYTYAKVNKDANGYYIYRYYGVDFADKDGTNVERITKEQYDDIANNNFRERKIPIYEQVHVPAVHYTLEEQQEEALVELLGLLTAGKLDEVKHKSLIGKLRQLLREVRESLKKLLTAKELEIIKLPENTTLGDLATVLAFSKSKLILPGYTVEYTTPDGTKYKTRGEANRHITEIAKKAKEASDGKLLTADDVLDTPDYDNATVDDLPTKFKAGRYTYVNLGDGKWLERTHRKAYDVTDKDALRAYKNTGKPVVREFTIGNTTYTKSKVSKRWFTEIATEIRPGVSTKSDGPDMTHEEVMDIYNTSKGIEDVKSHIYETKEKLKPEFEFLKSFLDRNYDYEVSKRVIEKWIKDNNISYNPEEIYSRNMGFYSVMGAYSELDVKSVFQNIITSIENNQKLGDGYILSAFTRKIDGKSSLEIGGGKIRYRILPSSSNIKWAANADNQSGTVGNASYKLQPRGPKVKSERAGVSHSKYPGRVGITKANLVDAITPSGSGSYNELGIELTGNNFRVEYDVDVPQGIKDVIDALNKTLDQKYGKLDVNKPYAKYNQGIKSKFIPAQNNTDTLEHPIADIYTKVHNEVKGKAGLLVDKAVMNLNILKARQASQVDPRSMITSEVVSTDKQTDSYNPYEDMEAWDHHDGDGGGWGAGFGIFEETEPGEFELMEPEDGKMPIMPGEEGFKFKGEGAGFGGAEMGGKVPAPVDPLFDPLMDLPFQKVRSSGGPTKKEQKGIIFTSNYTGELLPMRRMSTNDPTRQANAAELKAGEFTTLPAQVMIPAKFKEADGELLDMMQFVDETTGLLDTNRIPKELLELFGFRIPTQGHNSMSYMEVVGFLPKSSGDLIIAPRDFIAQMGSDFDVDKLFTYMKNYQHVYGSAEQRKMLDIMKGELHDAIYGDKGYADRFNEDNRDQLVNLADNLAKIQTTITTGKTAGKFAKLSKERQAEFIEAVKDNLRDISQEELQMLNDARYTDDSKGDTTVVELYGETTSLSYQVAAYMKSVVHEYNATFSNDKQVKEMTDRINSYKDSFEVDSLKLYDGKNEEKKLQNEIIEIYMQVMKKNSADVQSLIAEPLGFGDLPELAANVSEARSNRDMSEDDREIPIKNFVANMADVPFDENKTPIENEETARKHWEEYLRGKFKPSDPDYKRVSQINEVGGLAFIEKGAIRRTKKHKDSPWEGGSDSPAIRGFARAYRNVAQEAGLFQEGLPELDQPVRKFTGMSDSYQRDLYIFGTSGKAGVAIFSNTAIFNATTQGKEIVVESIEAMPIGFGDQVSKGTLGYTLDKEGNAVYKTLSGKKYISEAIASFQNAAVDNANEQLMDKINAHPNILNTVNIMLLLGFDESTIVHIISQDAIFDFVEELGNLTGSLDSNNGDPSFQAKEIVFEKYKKLALAADPKALTDEKTQEEILDYYQYTDSKSPKALFEYIKNGKDVADYALVQLSIMDKFYDLLQAGKIIQGVQSSTNLDSKGLPKSVMGAKIKKEQVAGLYLIDGLNKQTSGIRNATKLLGTYSVGQGEYQVGWHTDKDTGVAEPLFLTPNTLKGHATVESLRMVDKLYLNDDMGALLPYNNKELIDVFDAISDEAGKFSSSVVLKEKFYQELFDHLKSYMYTHKNSGISKNPVADRKRLFYTELMPPVLIDKGLDSEQLVPSTEIKKHSLASIIRDIQASGALAGNPLIQRLTTEINLDGSPSLIKFNAAATENHDERTLYAAFQELINDTSVIKGTDMTGNMLAKDLVKYAVLSGGIQQAVQFVKYIPVSFLSTLGLNQHMRNSRFDDRSTYTTSQLQSSSVFSPTFMLQFFQHNPYYATTYDHIRDFTEMDKPAMSEVNSFKLKDDAEILKKRASNGKMGDPLFISMKIGKKYHLFQKMPDNKYHRIPTLGTFGMNEYNANEHYTQTTVVANDAPGFTPIVEPDFSDTSEFTPIDNRGGGGIPSMGIRKVPGDPFNMHTGNHLAMLEGIITDPGTSDRLREFSVGLHRVLMAKRTEVDMTVEEGKAGTGGWAQNIGPNKFRVSISSNSGHIRTTIVHELVHVATYEDIELFMAGKLKGPKAKILRKIERYAQFFDATMEQKHGVEGWRNMKANMNKDEKGFNTVRKGVKGFANVEYAGYNLHEFITLSTTKPEFQEYMSETIWKGDTSFYDRFISLMADLFKALGITVNMGDDVSKLVTDEVLNLFKVDVDAATQTAARRDAEIDAANRAANQPYSTPTASTPKVKQKPRKEKSYKFSDGITIDVEFNPTKEQGKFLEALPDFVNKDNADVIVLSGGAGTGKTTTITSAIAYLDSKQVDYTLAAPTHAARDVLSDATDTKSITVASVLGLSPNTKLEHVNINNIQFKAQNSKSMPTGGILVVDEASMLDDALVNELIKHAKARNTQIIFIGDYKQLKPVGQNGISKVFNDKNTHELTEVKRTSKTNPALPDVILKIRESMRDKGDTTTPILRVDKFTHEDRINTETGEGIEFYKDPVEFTDELKQAFKDAHENGLDSKVRAYAYTNARVRELNKLIRSTLQPKGSPAIVPGDLLLGYKNLYWDKGEYHINNTGEYKVLETQALSDGTGWRVTVEAVRSGAIVQRQIVIANPKKYDMAKLMHIKELAAKFHAANPNDNGREYGIWQSASDAYMTTEDFYYIDGVMINDAKEARRILRSQFPSYSAKGIENKLGKTLIKSKDYDYAYARTIHKSQGSEYDTVFVDEDNIDTMISHKYPDYENWHRLKYVAFSRGKKNIKVKSNKAVTSVVPAVQQESPNVLYSIEDDRVYDDHDDDRVNDDDERVNDDDDRAYPEDDDRVNDDDDRSHPDDDRYPDSAPVTNRFDHIIKRYRRSLYNVKRNITNLRKERKQTGSLEAKLKIVRLEKRETQLRDKIAKLQEAITVDQIHGVFQEQLTEIRQMLGKEYITIPELNRSLDELRYMIHVGTFEEGEPHVLLNMDEKDSEAIVQDFTNIKRDALVLENKIWGKAELLILEIVQKNHKDITITKDAIKSAMHDSSWQKTHFMGLSRIDDDLIAAISKEIQRANDAAHLESFEVKQEIDKLFNKAKGTLKKVRIATKSKDDFDIMKQKDASGAVTGRLVLPWTDAYINEQKRSAAYWLSNENSAAANERYKKKRADELMFDVRKLFPTRTGDNIEYTKRSFTETDRLAHITELKAHLGEKLFKYHYDKIAAQLEEFQEDFISIRNLLRDNDDMSDAEKNVELNVWVKTNSPYIAADAVIQNDKPRETKPDGTIGYIKVRGQKYTQVVPRRYRIENGVEVDTGWYDKNYLEIEKHDDVYELYEYFRDTLSELHAMLPEDMRRNMKVNDLMFIEKTNWAKAMDRGISLSSTIALARDVYDDGVNKITTGDSDVDYIDRDPVTGAHIPKVQLHITQEYNLIQQEFRFRLSDWIAANPDVYKYISSNFKDRNGTQIYLNADNFQTALLMIESSLPLMARHGHDGRAIADELMQLERKAKEVVIQDKNMDIGTVIKMYANKVITYHHKTRTEDTLNMGIELQHRRKEIVASGRGDQQTGNEGEKLAIKGLPHITKFINYARDVHYGLPARKPQMVQNVKLLTSKEKAKKKRVEKIEASLEANDINENPFEEQDRSTSIGGYVHLSGIGDSLIQTTQLKSMAYNVQSGLANVTFGALANIVEAADGRIYGLGTYFKALGMVFQHSFFKNLLGNVSYWSKIVGGPALESDTAVKIRSIMDRFNFSKDASDELYKASSEAKRKHWRFLGLYQIQKRTEYMNQAPVMIAMFLTKKVSDYVPGYTGDAKIWEAFGKDAKWDTAYGKEPNWTDLMLEVNAQIAKVHGNYNFNDPVMIKKTVQGRAGVQFKTWMFEGMATRYEEEKTDRVLNVIRKGRHKTAGALISGIVIPKYLTDRSGTPIGRLESIVFLWKALVALTPWEFTGDKRLESRLSDVDAANLKAVTMELILAFGVVLGGVGLLGLMLKGDEDDDDEKSWVYNALVNNMNRAWADFFQYANPNTLKQIGGTPFAATSAITDVLKSIYTIANKFYFDPDADILRSGTFKGKSKATRATLKAIPIVNNVPKIYSTLNTDFWNKDKKKKSTSKPKARRRATRKKRTRKKRDR